MNRIKLFAGSGNPDLSKEISGLLSYPLGNLHIGSFADGEIGIWIEEDVWGENTIVVAPTCCPVNDRLIELALLIDAIRRGGARMIMAVVPYFGYARQDRQTRIFGSEPISAKVAATLLENCGATSIFTVDIHAMAETGFLRIPFINIKATSIFVEALKKEDLVDAVVVSPDEGGVERALDLAGHFDLPVAFLTKEHVYDRFDRQNQVNITDLAGDVKGKTAIIYDDIASSGQTLFKNAKKLKDKGAEKIIACVTHCVFIPEAYGELDKSSVDKLFVTDTVPVYHKSRKLKILSVASLLASEIKKRVE